MGRRALGELLDGYELPSFPAVKMKTLAALRDPASSMGDVSQALQADPGLHLWVLRMANSAALGLASEVSNVQRAVSLLGRARIETLVLTHVIKDTLPDVDVPGFDLRRFWLTAARRAFLAQAVAARLHPGTRLEAFTAGLLQDMAVPVLATAHREAYVDVFDRWRGHPGSRLDELERDAFATDHAQVGALMASSWELPADLQRAIRHHHDWMERDDIDEAVGLVSLVDDRDRDDLERPLAELAERRSVLSPELVGTLLEDSFDAADGFAAAFG